MEMNLNEQKQALQLANKIALHITLDTTPGYVLSLEDQKLLVKALRYFGKGNLK